VCVRCFIASFLKSWRITDCLVNLVAGIAADNDEAKLVRKLKDTRLSLLGLKLLSCLFGFSYFSHACSHSRVLWFAMRYWLFTAPLPPP